MRILVALLASLTLLPAPALATHSQPVPSDCEYIVRQTTAGVYLVIVQAEHSARPECLREQGVWIESNGRRGWQGSAYHPDWDTHVG